MKDNAIPQFRKPSVVPYALCDAVTSQIREWEQKGIVKKLDFCDWASQLVIVPKKDGGIRMCCNFKPTLNPYLERNDYPIPNMDDILHRLSDNRFFSVLDLSGAYLQLALDEESQKFTTVNTPLGLYAFRSLPFGVKTAPGIFQEVIDKILNGRTPGVITKEKL